MQSSSMHISQINIFPIKSSASISLSTSWIDGLGLVFDRRFVVSDLQGQFITARTAPKLCLIQANLTATGMILTAPDMPKLIVDYSSLSPSYMKIGLWNDQINAQHCHDDHQRWFSQYLQTPCQLLYFGEKSQRTLPNESNRTDQLAFADGYPILLISQASLDDLNQRRPKSAKNEFTMSQFRPNIVVQSEQQAGEAFVEDTWSHIRIGEVEFEVKKSCTRCIFTTINPQTAELHPQQEPLNTLKSYRQAAEGELSGEVLFGQNLVPLNQGQIKLNDTVTVIRRKSPPIFTAKAVKNKTVKIDLVSTPAESQIKKKVNLNFDSWNKVHKGNNQTSILEQGEAAGLILPYSCRAGMCGRCKVKLTSGEVTQLATDGLSDDEKNQGYILICSCIPQTDVVLSRT